MCFYNKDRRNTELHSLRREALGKVLCQERGPALGIPALFGVHDLAEASAKMASRTKALTTIASSNQVFARWPNQTGQIRSFQGPVLNHSRSEIQVKS